MSTFNIPDDLPLSDKDINADAERSVVSALARHGAKDPASAAALITKHGIDADLFFYPDIRAAYIAVADLLADGQPPTAATIRALPAHKSALIELETILENSVSAVSNMGCYVKVLKRCQRNREVLQAHQWLEKAIYQRRPIAEIRAITDGIERLSSGDNRKKSRFVAIEDFCKLPPAETWLIRNYLESDSLAVLFGESGCFKSFLAIDLCGHIATGRPWRGQRVRKGLCLYIAGEGANGLRARFKAWFEDHDEDPQNVAVLTVQQSICDPAGVQALIDEVRDFLSESDKSEPVLIVLDTLATNYGPFDENSTKDMTAFVAGLRSIRLVFECCVMVVHHSGYSAKERGRGSSVLHSGVDWVYRMEKLDEVDPDDDAPEPADDDDDGLEPLPKTALVCVKSKDSAFPTALAWQACPIDLPWADSDGVPMNSVILQPVSLPETAKKKKRKAVAGKLQAALTALKTLAGSQGSQSSRLTTGQGGVPLGDWQAELRKVEPNKTNRPRLKRDLLARGYIRVENGFVYLN
jgi:hypothetical protein